MNKISKDKRDKLVLFCLLFLGLGGSLYTFVLGSQNDQLATLHKQIVIARDKASKADRLIRTGPTIEANLAENRKQLEAQLENMAPQGQYYYWFLKLIDQFREEEKLSPTFIIDITQPEFIEAGLMPNFPYRAASFGMRLNGQFQDIGRFIADLENSHPYFRVQSLKIAPQRGGMLGTTTLVKDAPNPPAPTDTLVVELRVVTLIRGGTT